MEQSLDKQDSTLVDSINEALLGRLNLEATVSQQLRGIICDRQACLDEDPTNM